MSQLDCGTVQDRMPDVANGTARWSPAESAHVASCESCALEWRVVDAARRLGDSAVRQMDPSKVAHQVIAGVRSAKRRSRWTRASWLSGLAAAAVLVIILRVGEPNRPAAVPLDTTTVAVLPTSAGLPMAELDVLDEDQLQAVLEQLDGAVGGMDGGVVPRMGDLDDQQLERVLRSLEG